MLPIISIQDLQREHESIIFNQIYAVHQDKISTRRVIGSPATAFDQHGIFLN